MNDDKLYHKAVKKWGKRTQLLMAVEEMSELTFWLCKLIREEPMKYSRREEEILGGIAEEMADVEIMLGQLRYMLVNGMVVDSIKDFKKKGMLERLGS